MRRGCEGEEGQTRRGDSRVTHEYCSLQYWWNIRERGEGSNGRDVSRTLHWEMIINNKSKKIYDAGYKLDKECAT